MFPAVGHLEGLAGELSCANVADDELAEIRAMHYQMVLHFRRGDRLEYPAQPAARNKTLAGIHRRLATRIRHARHLANMMERRWAKDVEEHEEILNALFKRDGPRLAALLKSHLPNEFEAVGEGLSTAIWPAAPKRPTERSK
jgi:DNA-binding GntR family transcriptional regulator